MTPNPTLRALDGKTDADLVGEIATLRAMVLELRATLASIMTNDKTVYEYKGKDRLNRDGHEPRRGTRWATPRELADEILRDTSLDAYGDKGSAVATPGGVSGRRDERVERAAKAGQALAIRWGHQPWSDSWATLVAKTILDSADA